MDSEEHLFIKQHFEITECYKFANSEAKDHCVCGRSKNLHEISDSKELWSRENNTRSSVCYGIIKFRGYNEKYDGDHAKFLRFFDKKVDEAEKKVFQLLENFWGFPPPTLLISVTGGFKRMNFNTQLQKKHFQQGLIDVMNKENTWLIGGGSKVGIHQLLSETVNEYRIFHDGHQNSIKLIGICTWGVVQNKENLLSENCVYKNSDTQVAKSVLLDSLYDCYLFCDDGTEKEYDKEIDFRLKFENHIKNQGNVFSVQILFEGGQRALEKVYMSLKQSMPLVVISGSGRAADIISKVMNLTDTNRYKKDISAILNKFKDQINFGNSTELITGYLVDMVENYKNNIILHDICQDNIKLDRNIVKAVYSSLEYKAEGKTEVRNKTVNRVSTSQSQDENKKKTEMLKLMVTYNCYDLAKMPLFQNRTLKSFPQEKLSEMLLDVIKKNRPEFVGLFLDNYFEDKVFFNSKTIAELYKKSLNECTCGNLLQDLIINKKKNLSSDEMKIIYEDGKLLNSIYKIIRLFSGNILRVVNVSEDSSNNVKYGEVTANYNNSSTEMNMVCRRANSDKKKKININDDSDQEKIDNIKDLFLWALLSGYIELAAEFWKRLQYPVGSALIASIILNKMHILLLERGDSDMSDVLFKASMKFQKMGVSIISESYTNDKSKTLKILYRKMYIWNNLSCLQIAISGKLLNFLHQSACRSYTNDSWMGELSTFLSTGKILLAIPVIPFCFKPIWMSLYSQKKRHAMCSTKSRSKPSENSKEISNNEYISQISNNKNSNNDNANSIIIINQMSCNETCNKVSCDANDNRLSYKEAIKIFYQAPKVKFIVYLSSYIVFLLIFAYLNLVEMKPFDKNTKIKNLSAEIFVYIYVFGLFIEEIIQIKNQETSGIKHKLSAYFSGSWNIYDVSVMSVFIISTIFRFSLDKDNFIIARCLFSATFSLFVLRTMQFYFISRIIGPKIIMIRKMMFDILFFLSIFSLFIISYGTLIQTLQQENNVISLSLIKDVFYRPYFQTYGELMLDNFSVPSPCNTTSCIVQYTTMICGFAVFLLLTNILLINLLIAMFGHTFHKIQDESAKIFAFIQIQLVEEFYKKSAIMPPFNIISYMWSGAIKFYNYFRQTNTKEPDSFLVKNLNPMDFKRISQYEMICFKYALLKAQPEKDVAEDLESEISSN